jgi:hypothetical protein
MVMADFKNEQAIPAGSASPKLDPVSYSDPAYNMDARTEVGSVDGSFVKPVTSSQDQAQTEPGPK